MEAKYAEDILRDGLQPEENLESWKDAKSLLGRSVLNYHCLPGLHLPSLGPSLLVFQMLVQCRRPEWAENEVCGRYILTSPGLFSITRVVSQQPLPRVKFLLKMRVTPPRLTGKVLRQTLENDPGVPDLFKSEKTKASHPTCQLHQD